MKRVLIIGLALALGCRGGKAQAPRSVRAVAVIESVHADSSGRAVWNGRLVPVASLDSMLTRLAGTVGGTIWFSWSGGPRAPRTDGQERLLAHLRASGVRVELRTDSTFRSRVIRP